MTSRPPLPPGPFLIVGLARSGAAAATLLRDRGQVIAYDAGSPETGDLNGIEVRLGGDGVELLDRVGTVVKSPGVPQTAPVIHAARQRGIEVLGELEMAWRLLPNEFVAVTGTNGKTTTTELIGAIYRDAGRPVEVAGNVGTALSSLVGATTAGTVIVAECSSFQLEDSTDFAPECAALLNLEEDHLDRHGTMEAYEAAKLRIFANQTEAAAAVTPFGFAARRGENGRQLPGSARTFLFGGGSGDLTVRNGDLHWRDNRLMAASEVRLRGAHNLNNAMAAATAALAGGVDFDPVRRALAAFPGVEHRLEEVAIRNGVLYVNDSKATNVASTRVALAAFDGGVHLIAGGSLKGGGFTALRDLVSTRCRGVYLIGEATARLAQDLEGTAPLHDAGDLERAVAEARRAAAPGDVVLLSPACASYDQYKNFEDRGRHFRRLVEA